MKMLYIPAQIPWGKGETYILSEMIEIKRQGLDLLIIPRNPPVNIFHGKATGLVGNAIWMPLINAEMIITFLKSLLVKRCIWKVLGLLIRYSRNPWIFIKNAVILPKGIYIANQVPKFGVNHIHAHWGSTTASMAYIISECTGIPWSFTLHRWDIDENNMLAEKIRSAKFVRCISEDGKNNLLRIIGTEFKDKIKVIHMGVNVPSGQSEALFKNKKSFKIVTPANLLPVKGHAYLIKACSILVKEGIRNFECIFYGYGLMRNELEKLIKKEALNDYIKMPGIIPLEKLITMYRNNEVDLVILPSINTKDNNHEGIPVSLMEAMAYSIPVISTNTGGISELLFNESGVMIEEKNSQILAKKMKKLLQNENIRRKIGRQGYKRISMEFNIEENTKKLVNIFMHSL